MSAVRAPLCDWRPSFNELLHYDPTLSTSTLVYRSKSLDGSAHEGTTNLLSWSSRWFANETDTTEGVLPVSKDLGVMGPNRQLVVNELHRIRHAVVRTERRRRSLVAGLLSLLITSYSAFLGILYFIAIVQQQDGTHKRDGLRWAVDVGGTVACFDTIFLCPFLILWLRLVRALVRFFTFDSFGVDRNVVVAAHRPDDRRRRPWRPTSSP